MQETGTNDWFVVPASSLDAWAIWASVAPRKVTVAYQSPLENEGLLNAA